MTPKDRAKQVSIGMWSISDRVVIDRIEGAIIAAIEEEREANAKVAEDRGGPIKQEERHEESIERAACHQIAALIRARSQKET